MAIDSKPLLDGLYTLESLIEQVTLAKQRNNRPTEKGASSHCGYYFNCDGFLKEVTWNKEGYSYQAYINLKKEIEDKVKNYCVLGEIGSFSIKQYREDVLLMFSDSKSIAYYPVAKITGSLEYKGNYSEKEIPTLKKGRY